VKSSRVSRVVQILTTLQSAKGYAVSELAQIFGMSRRTIFRDLKELQALGVPYHYDAKSASYTIDPRVFPAAHRPEPSRGPESASAGA